MVSGRSWVISFTGHRLFNQTAGEVADGLPVPAMRVSVNWHFLRLGVVPVFGLRIVFHAALRLLPMW